MIKDNACTFNFTYDNFFGGGGGHQFYPDKVANRSIIIDWFWEDLRGHCIDLMT